MIGLPAGTRIWIAAGVTDLRRGFTGLSGMVQTTLQENPFFWSTCSFSAVAGDLIKMLWWAGRWAMSFRKTDRPRKIHLAASDKRNSVAYASTVIDVA